MTIASCLLVAVTEPERCIGVIIRNNLGDGQTTISCCTQLTYFVYTSQVIAATWCRSRLCLLSTLFFMEEAAHKLSGLLPDYC